MVDANSQSQGRYHTRPNETFTWFYATSSFKAQVAGTSGRYCGALAAKGHTFRTTLMLEIRNKRKTLIQRNRTALKVW